MKLSQEVIDLMAQMKIKPDFSNVRQRLRNASMTTKIKYKHAALSMCANNLLESKAFGGEQ